MKRLIKKILDSKFSRDTIWLIGAQFLVLLVGFALNFGIEEQYGLEELGYFSQTTSFYLIFANLFALGLNNTTIKRVSEFSESKEAQNRIFSQNLFVSIAISTALSLIVYFVLIGTPELFSSKVLVELLSIQIVGVPFFSANKQFAAFYSGRRMQREFAIQRLIRWGGIGILLLLIIIFSYPLIYVILAFVFTEFVLFVYNIIRNLKQLRFQLISEEIKQNLSFGLKSYIAEILAVFNSNMDIILLGYLLSPKDLGIYSFMIFFVKALYIFPGIIMQNISPVVSKLWESKQIDELQRKIKSIVKVNFLMASLQFLGLIVFYFLMVGMFKKSMNGSGWYFVTAGVGAFVFSLVSWSGSMLIMSGKLRVNFYRTLMVLIVSTVNITIFAYSFGLLGACLAIGVNGVFNFLIIRLLIKKEMGINIFL